MTARDDYPALADEAIYGYGAEKDESGLVLDEVDRLRAEVADLRARRGHQRNERDDMTEFEKSLEQRSMARARQQLGDCDDLPDDAIRSTYTFAWVRLRLAVGDLGRAMVASFRHQP